MDIITPESAAQEVLQRKKIRRSLIRWSTYRHSEEPPAKHHRYLLKILQRLCRGKLLKNGKAVRNLMVLMPPGSAKSTYTSIDFVTWFFANYPNKRILACSCNADLAGSFGRHCRNIVQQESSVLGYSLAGDSQAVDKWSTSNGGEYLALGVGASISGRRADFGLIDDYLGSQEDADSKTIRDKQKAWYDNDFWPRLKPNAIQVIVANRRHEDDLVGRILKEEADDWLVIRLPMLAEANDPLGRQPGERLWPEYFTEAMVAKAKRFSRTWGGLYQQRPAPEEGNYFKSDWLVGYSPDQRPKYLEMYCVSDHACTTKETSKDDPDSTLLVPFGIDEGKNIWLFPDFWWEMADTGTVVRKMIEMMKLHQPIAWIAETEHIVKSIGPFLKQAMRDENIFTTRIQELSGRRDKVAKARSAQGLMEFRKFYFPTFSTRWNDVRDQILTFPAGSHDEWPDVLGSIGRYIQQYLCATPEVEPDNYSLPTGFSITLGELKSANRRKDHELQLLHSGL